ncbi:Hypothetical predicted protein [Podarcis lilfordi]|uniref:Uncharacterized protein n=1 Tax=Podarcis lilfordi TaxID=74358 RepID=A0AA35KR73_9SAUR|nr:Hypothetical predicted protein [Podarcis lilfordi]
MVRFRMVVLIYKIPHPTSPASASGLPRKRHSLAIDKTGLATDTSPSNHGKGSSKKQISKNRHNSRPSCQATISKSTRKTVTVKPLMAIKPIYVCGVEQCFSTKFLVDGGLQFPLSLTAATVGQE